MTRSGDFYFSSFLGVAWFWLLEYPRLVCEEEEASARHRRRAEGVRYHSADTPASSAPRREPAAAAPPSLMDAPRHARSTRQISIFKKTIGYRAKTILIPRFALLCWAYSLTFRRPSLTGVRSDPTLGRTAWVCKRRARQLTGGFVPRSG